MLLPRCSHVAPSPTDTCRLSLVSLRERLTIYVGSSPALEYTSRRATGDRRHQMLQLGAGHDSAPMLPSYFYRQLPADWGDQLPRLKNTPTASSAHRYTNAAMNILPINTRCLRGALLAANTNKPAEPNNSDPMTMKSVSSQLTSVVNCIAIRGISKIAPVASAIQIKTLF